MIKTETRIITKFKMILFQGGGIPIHEGDEVTITKDNELLDKDGFNFGKMKPESIAKVFYYSVPKYNLMSVK